MHGLINSQWLDGLEQRGIFVDEKGIARDVHVIGPARTDGIPHTNPHLDEFGLDLLWFPGKGYFPRFMQGVLRGVRRVWSSKLIYPQFLIAKPSARRSVAAP